MLEMLLKSKPNTVYQTLVDIDFSLQNVGDNFIVNQSPARQFTVARGTPGSVVYDATLGKNVMPFSNVAFSCPNLNLTKDKAFVIEVQFKASSSANTSLFGTGAYYDSTQRWAGINFTLSQYLDNYMQLFVDNGGSEFNRLFFNVAYNTSWQNVRMTYTPGVSWVFERLDTGATITYPPYPFGEGIDFAIGGFLIVPVAYYFQGSLARLKIKLL